MRTAHLLVVLFAIAALLAVMSTLAPPRSRIRAPSQTFSEPVYLYPPPMPPPPPPPQQQLLNAETGFGLAALAVTQKGAASSSPPSPAATSPPASLAQTHHQDALCPPHRRGDACNQPAFPACARQWGLDTNEIAPCFYWPHARLPVSCECLVQCEAVGHAARTECLHNQPVLELPSYGLRVTSLANFTAPWKGNPKELARVWPELTIHYDPGLFAQLHAAGTAAASAGRCGAGRGIDLSLVPSRAETVRQLLRPPGGFGPGASCVCVPGFDPPHCVPKRWRPENCFNSCSGRGACVAGTCVCEAHAHGIDCSAGAAVVPPHPTSTSSIGSPAATTERAATAGRVSPRVYVYELPAEFTSWLALPRAFGESERQSDSPAWWQLTDPMYSADTRLLNRLLVSPHRTLQPETADFFYIPLMLSLGFVSHRFGIYLPSAPAARLIARAIAYVRSAFPFWNRTGGSDHMLPFTGDDGSTWLRGRLPELARAIFITHWGMQCNDRRLRARPQHCVQSQMGFRPHRSGQDIVLPPLHSPHNLLPSSAWLRNQSAYGPPPASLSEAAYMLLPTRQYKYLLYFVGKVSRHKREGDIYSGGVRQRIYLHHANRTDFYLREKPGGRGSTTDMDALRNSKFCLAPHGTGFGMRQFDAIAHGCVPLIVKVKWDEDPGNGGELEQPFAEVIPWNALALHLTRVQIPKLPEILAAVTPERHALYRKAAACVWPRLFWMPVPSGERRHAVDQRVVPRPAKCGASCMGELERMEPHDAFGTFLWLLRERLQERRRAVPTGSDGGGAQLSRWLPALPHALSGSSQAREALEVDEQAATRWERLEAQWELSMAQGARHEQALRVAPWRTPAASCELALSMA